MTLPVRLLEYSAGIDLADELQTIAVAQHVSPSTGFVDRANQSAWTGEPCAVVQQTRLTTAASIPTSAAIRPVWIGVDLDASLRDVLRQDVVRRAFDRHGPVGCRTSATAELLADAGIDAHVSGCLTTTFPHRRTAPPDGRIFLVDTGEIPLPDQLDSPAAVRVTLDGLDWWSQDAKRVLARDLLERFRLEAKLVVTTRVHAASAAVAIGVPVVFLGDPDDPANEPIDGRVEFVPVPDAIRGGGSTARARRRNHWKREMQHHAWIGFAKDVEAEKRTIVQRLHERLADAGVYGPPQEAAA